MTSNSDIEVLILIVSMKKGTLTSYNIDRALLKEGEYRYTPLILKRTIFSYKPFTSASGC